METQDKELANMGDSKGWAIFKKRVEARIVSLLVPYDFPPETPTTARYALYEARFAIARALSEELQTVERAQQSIQIRDKQKESEKGDEDGE
jgi:hypothetical protein